MYLHAAHALRRLIATIWLQMFRKRALPAQGISMLGLSSKFTGEGVMSRRLIFHHCYFLHKALKHAEGVLAYLRDLLLPTM